MVKTSGTDYSDYQDIDEFIESVVRPVKCGIQVKGDMVILTPYTSEDRGKLIGRAAVHLRSMESIVQRYFKIRKITVTQVKESYT